MHALLRQYRHIIGAGIIAVVLGLPFGLKLLSSRLEIYPAILLPAGAARVKSSGEWVQFTQIELIGLDLQTRVPRRIKAESFLHPVPMQYLYAFVGREFGLNPAPDRDIPIRGFYRIKRPPARPLGADDLEFTHAWLRTRLKRAGCSDDLLTVRTALRKLNKKTGVIEDVKILDEKNYRLR